MAVSPKGDGRGADGACLASIRQTSVLWRVLEKIPLLYGCPFVLRLGASEVGWFRNWPDLRQPHARGVVNGVEHRIYGHRGTVYSVYRWPDQIGLIDREAKSVCDGGKYRAEFDGDLDPVLCACCILFVDMAWHTDDDLRFSSIRYEWNVQIGGVPQNPDWRPREREIVTDEKEAAGGG